MSSNNIFDNLPGLASTSRDIRDELKLYLSTDAEDVKDGILWWYERRSTFPCLSQMARDYLSIPGKCIFYISTRYYVLIVSQATSIDVECIFSQGRLLLSHVCSHLSVHSTRALLCLGKWSELELVKDSDVRAGLTREEAGDKNVLVEDRDAI